MKRKPRKPDIDRTKHIPYSKGAEKYLLKVLREKYGDEQGLRRKDIPFIGGKKTSHESSCL